MRYLFQCLKKIYPDITQNDVVIETDNGQDKILEWHYPKSIPDTDQLENVYYEVLQEIASNEIRVIGNEKIKQIAIDIYQSEIDTYPIQESEARLYLKDKNIEEVPFISTLAKIRGISLDELVERIVKRAYMYKVAVATVLGYQQKNLDIIWSGKLTEEELLNYKWQE
jgi:hypothetical protein